MYNKVPLPDEGLFYTQQIDFEVIVEDVSDTESFDEYLWMENEEEFEKSEMQRLEEEALMEECAEAMLEEEEVLESLHLCPAHSTAESSDDDHDQLSDLPAAAEVSTLNPLAIEFIPAN